MFIVFKCNFKPLSLKRHFPACYCSCEENHIINRHNLNLAPPQKCFAAKMFSNSCVLFVNNLLVRVFYLYAL